MKLRHFIPISCILFATQYCYGQGVDPYKLPVVTPPSPEAAAINMNDLNGMICISFGCYTAQTA